MRNGSDKDFNAAVFRQTDWVAESGLKSNAEPGSATLVGFVHGCAIKLSAEDITKSAYVKSVGNNVYMTPMTSRKDYSAAVYQIRENIRTRTLVALNLARVK
jgi:hypothetical protein